MAFSFLLPPCENQRMLSGRQVSRQAPLHTEARHRP
ncbi:hypothetical protein LEMLEM_LOCUS20017 [Lemmus lemmus]